MTPEQLLEAFRETTGPDPDAKTRLRGRLAALGPPVPAPMPQARPAWPWVVVGGLAAAAALALWVVPRPQTRKGDRTEASMASDRADTDAAEHTAKHTAKHEAKPTALPRHAEPETPPRPLPGTQAPPAPETAPPSAQPTLAPRAAPRPRRRPAPASSDATPSPPPDPEPDTDSLAAELSLISRARAALARGDTADALALLRTHASRFEAPRLKEEASALRTMARCSQAGSDDAAARAFARTFPTSVFRARVTAACSPKNGSTPSSTPSTEKTSPD